MPLSAKGQGKMIVRNIQRAIQQGNFENEKELDQFISQLYSVIETEREPLEEMIRKRNECEHTDWNPPFYYLIRMVMGDFRQEYHRICKHCGKEEVVSSVKAGDVTLPDWTKEATNRYYNNNF